MNSQTDKIYCLYSISILQKDFIKETRMPKTLTEKLILLIINFM